MTVKALRKNLKKEIKKFKKVHKQWQYHSRLAERFGRQVETLEERIGYLREEIEDMTQK